MKIFLDSYQKQVCRIKESCKIIGKRIEHFIPSSAHKHEFFEGMCLKFPFLDIGLLALSIFAAKPQKLDWLNRMLGMFVDIHQESRTW